MQGIWKHELQNSQQPVNRLPHEILSMIFVLCKSKERERGYPDTFCHTTLPVICRYWRKVALKTTELWSLVTLFDSSPFKFSTLCLERAGPTAPLDIEIRLSKRFWCYSDNPSYDLYEEGIFEAFSTVIVENGGDPSRWRSFWIYTPGDTHIDPQLLTLSFIQSHPMPSLERLEVKYDGLHYNKNWEDQNGAVFDNPLFPDRPNHLRTATLEYIPNSCLFLCPNCSWLIGLTRLEVKFPVDLPHLWRVAEALIAIPALTVLSMDTRHSRRAHHDIDPDTQTLINLPGIYMPNLRTLGLMFTLYDPLALWEYTLLLMLDAPNVQNLRFWLMLENHRSQDPTRWDFIEYLVKGTDPAYPTPIFPFLTGLELFVKDQRGLRRADLERWLLAAYPGITTLVLPQAAEHSLLNQQPWLVPQLNRLLIDDGSPSELKEAIASRCAAGMGPKVVEIPVPGEGAKYEESEYRKALDGLGVEVCFSRWNHRVREVLGFEDF